MKTYPRNSFPMFRQFTLVIPCDSLKQARKYFAPLKRSYILLRNEVLVRGSMNPEKTFSETPCTIATFSSNDDRDYKSYDIDRLVSDAKKKGILLPHEQQHFNWDCGIACLRMVSLKKKEFSNHRLVSLSVKYFTHWRSLYHFFSGLSGPQVL